MAISLSHFNAQCDVCFITFGHCNKFRLTVKILGGLQRGSGYYNEILEDFALLLGFEQFLEFLFNVGQPNLEHYICVREHHDKP
mgnify:CR=1 FL=1